MNATKQVYQLNYATKTCTLIKRTERHYAKMCSVWIKKNKDVSILDIHNTQCWFSSKSVERMLKWQKLIRFTIILLMLLTSVAVRICKNSVIPASKRWNHSEKDVLTQSKSPSETHNFIPVFVKAALAFLTEMFSPDCLENTQSSGSFNVAYNTNNHHRWCFNDGNRFHYFLLVYFWQVNKEICLKYNKHEEFTLPNFAVS